MNSIRTLLNYKSGITYVEFLVIHHEAAIFFSSQRVSYINQSGLAARLKVRLQKIYDSLKNDNTFSFNIYGDKRYSQLIPFWLSSFPRVVVFPTFAYLDFYSFLELGIDVLPQGMTSSIRVAFDGEENNTAIDFKRHDDNHNETTLGAIDNLSKEEEVEIRRMSRFFRQYSTRITDNKRLVLFYLKSFMKLLYFKDIQLCFILRPKRPEHILFGMS